MFQKSLPFSGHTRLYLTQRKHWLHVTSTILRGTKSLDWYINALAQREASKDILPTTIFPSCIPLHGRKRARAYLDIATGTNAEAAANASRIVIELADDLVPLAVTNFLTLCERPVGSGYIGSEIFNVRKGVGLTMGDWVRGDGRGGHSAFERRCFVDENFIGRHATAGVLSMANNGVHSNNSVFMLTLAPLPHLDGRNVVFGRVLTGMDTVNKLGNVFTIGFKPATPLIISAAGRIIEGSPEWLSVDKILEKASTSTSSVKAKVVPPSNKPSNTNKTTTTSTSS
jgi:cyclophilin family peptidyl-prolyl cis-trans isomerase